MSSSGSTPNACTRQDEVARKRIEAALTLTAAAEEPDVAGDPDMAETSHRIPTPLTAVNGRFEPVTAGNHESALATTVTAGHP